MTADALDIANDIYYVTYGRDENVEDLEGSGKLGIRWRELYNNIYNKDLLWAPDGSAAFDDGSYVLHFENLNSCKLIAFKSTDAFIPDPDSLSDISMSADEFYGILKSWLSRFDTEWRSKTKV